jgi:hypothetical protein
VNSIDYWQRNRIEGYGHCEIPKETGFHEIVIKTWKPALNLQDRIFSFFLGGSIKVKDIESIAKVENETEGVSAPPLTPDERPGQHPQPLFPADRVRRRGDCQAKYCKAGRDLQGH